MKPTKRKLSLHAQTLRNLSPDALARIGGGYSSARATMCSTWVDTGCVPSGADFCNTLGCPTQGCNSNPC